MTIVDSRIVDPFNDAIQTAFIAFSAQDKARFEASVRQAQEAMADKPEVVSRLEEASSSFPKPEALAAVAYACQKAARLA